jgi:hypothetical protein
MCSVKGLKQSRPSEFDIVGRRVVGLTMMSATFVLVDIQICHHMKSLVIDRNRDQWSRAGEVLCCILDQGCLAGCYVQR